jgi:hypothetical protein
MSVIAAHSQDWLPLRLTDEASVGYLSELLAQGWYLMPLNVDGLAALAFVVPKDPEDSRRQHVVWSRERAANDDSFTVVVLRRGGAKGRQRAVVTARDAEGYLDLRDTHTMAGWHLVAMVQLETDGIVSLFERDEFTIEEEGG